MAQLVLTEDQELLAQTALDYVRANSPISRVRELRDSGDPVGFSRSMWQDMAQLGWVGILIPEEYGGAGMGLADFAVVMEALGRTLAPEPFLSTVLLAGQLLVEAGSPEQKRAWLPGIAAGDAILSLAYQEARSRYDLNRVGTTATAEDGAWRITGQKIQVLDGYAADALIVSARTAGAEADPDGISLFVIPKDAPGVSVVRPSRGLTVGPWRCWSWTA